MDCWIAFMRNLFLLADTGTMDVGTTVAENPVACIRLAWMPGLLFAKTGSHGPQVAYRIVG